MKPRKPSKEIPVLDPEVMDELLSHTRAVEPPGGLRARVLERVHGGGASHFVTLRDDEAWLSLAPGLEVKLLTYDTRSGSKSFLVRARAGAAMPAHSHQGYEECLVMQGEVQIGELVLRAGDFHGAAGDTHHPQVSTRSGALVYLRTAIQDYPEIHP